MTLAYADFAQMFEVPNTSPTFPMRVFKFVDASADCWIWTGADDGKGYGAIGRGARGAGTIAAHRAVWELLVGPIPSGMQYDHLCRNTICVNPDHGEIVTPAENNRRSHSISVRNASRETCGMGHPLDGLLGGRGSDRRWRYCKTCARDRAKRGEPS